MIRKTRGWHNFTEALVDIIEQYGKGGILIALMNANAWILYKRCGYRRGDSLNWLKRAVEELITEIQNREESGESLVRQPRPIYSADFSDL